MKTSVREKEVEQLIETGWQALVEKLGIPDATRFIMAIDKGSGDSVKYFRELWNGKTSEDIYKKLKDYAGNEKEA